MACVIGSVPEEEEVAIQQLPQPFCPEVLQCTGFCQHQGGHEMEDMVLHDTAALCKLDQGCAVELILVQGLPWGLTWGRVRADCVEH